MPSMPNDTDPRLALIADLAAVVVLHLVGVAQTFLQGIGEVL